MAAQMITGIPPYTDRPIQSLRCQCGLRYVVLIGDDNERAALMEALRIEADFIDARRLLAFECYCGAMIDVSPDITQTVQ